MIEKFHIEITSEAERDVADIWEYIAEDSPTAATRFVQELQQKAETLKTFPLRCPPIPQQPGEDNDYRHLIVGGYRIIFRVSENTVYVVHILHGSKLLDLNTNNYS